ncbi:uncharacterized protein LOC117232909 [Bombus vosnesenskii]|uniref:Uncharacterized protein LOC117232909 n=1 Tax=Bombus vosnesenskii TaxID=207650 RepID=A0A6J3K7F0_9HYME|nr:uncharacterized protein LOC117232909 [Bombus vosnesenskii]
MSGLVQIHTRTCTHMYSVKVPLHFQEMVGIVMLVSKVEFRPVSKTLLHSMKRVDIYKTTADELNKRCGYSFIGVSLYSLLANNGRDKSKASCRARFKKSAPPKQT